MNVYFIKNANESHFWAWEWPKKSQEYGFSLCFRTKKLKDFIHKKDDYFVYFWRRIALKICRLSISFLGKKVEKTNWKFGGGITRLKGKPHFFSLRFHWNSDQKIMVSRDILSKTWYLWWFLWNRFFHFGRAETEGLQLHQNPLRGP